MRPRQFSDQQLYRTACQCFLAEGPNVSIADIAAKLGVSGAALFKRVGTKEELLCRSMVHDLQPTWIELAEWGPKAGSNEESVRSQLLELAVEIDCFLARLVPRIAVLKAARIDPEQMFCDFDEAPPVRGVRALQQWFSKIAQDNLAVIPNPAATAVAFLGALQSRHFMRHLLGVSYPDGGTTYVADFVATFWAGIAPKENQL